MEQLCKLCVNVSFSLSLLIVFFSSIKDTVGERAIYLCVYLVLSSESPALLA